MGWRRVSGRRLRPGQKKAFPGFKFVFERLRGIGRACGRQSCAVPMGALRKRGKVLVEKSFSGGTVEKHAANARVGSEETGDVVDLNGAGNDRAIEASVALTAGNDIPQGDMVLEHPGKALTVCGLSVKAAKTPENWPKQVTGVGVVFAGLEGCHAGHAAEYERVTARIDDGRKRVV